MDNFDYPYYGTNYSGSYNSNQDNSKTDESSKSGLSADEKVLSAVLIKIDFNRANEIDLKDYDFSNNTQSSVYGIYPFEKNPPVAFFTEPGRNSIHPLGIIEKPQGVTKEHWKLLDADNLFLLSENTGKDTVSQEITSPENPLENVPEESMVKKFIRRSKGTVREDKAGDNSVHDSKEMPFLDHLEELRWAILKSIFVIIAGMIGSWYLADWFYREVTDIAKPMGVKIVFTKLLEPLMLRLQMSFVMGLVVSLPFVFYFLWSFISPGLYNHEKRWIMPLIFVSTGCFFIGSALAWFLIIPFMLKFMQNFNLPGTEGMLTIGPFVSLLLKLTISFGVIFELPVVSFILAKIGILKYKFMTKYRKYALVVAFIVAAIITPTVDPVTQTITAVPLYVLYEISIFVAMIAGKKTLL